MQYEREREANAQQCERNIIKKMIFFIRILLFSTFATVETGNK